MPGPATERVAALARELGIYVAFGMIERDAADPSVLYNAAAFVGPDGIAVIAIYTMEKQPDGTWRIAAVQLIPTGEISS